jgi:glucose/arabinose dehydrogenase
MKQLILLLVLGWGGSSAVSLNPLVSGLSAPVAITHAGDGSSRLFVTEQGGKIQVIEKGALLPQPFLDLSSLTRGGGERGLLSVAFDPKFKQNGRLFVNYTDTSGNTIISRYTAKPDRKSADPSSAKILLKIEQPYANHNGGQLVFGPDGFLYIGMGDGGSGGDPQNRAQNMAEWLGKMLRIDVSGEAYTIPESNPFVKTSGARGEIWAYGLRNPWRFSFDRKTGDLWIGDVGQNKLEEIDFQSASSKGGENYGWRLKEANQCFNPSDGCNSSGLVEPVFQYSHSEGQSVTGGYVYRGKKISEWLGKYIFADFASGKLWATARAGKGFKTSAVMMLNKQPSSFGEDEAGELYVADYGSGTIFSFVK